MFSRQYLGTNNPAEILSEADMKCMSQLDEKSKRRFLATKAIPLGCHGVTWVAEASGVNRDTIYKGIHELKADEQIPKGRVRKPGGGSKRLLDKNGLSTCNGNTRMQTPSACSATEAEPTHACIISSSRSS